MSSTVIRVENLSKRYVIKHACGRASGDGLRHAIQDAATKPFRAIKRALRPKPDSNLNSSTSTSEDFWALKDVSFEVRRGEILGIIGRNGAGKSTLLKILSRITEPSSGRIGIKGRVASLLEVGTGFHPELTGCENIHLNGAILGMSRVEVKRKFDEIVEFAGVERFLDTPVKRYSSGMYVRLAFAVAAHLEPEILIVDEVLAVGDAEFQAKCLGKMKDVAGTGRTVLFVSHNMAAVSALCSEALLLGGGKVLTHGSPSKAIADYVHLFKAAQTATAIVGRVGGVRLSEAKTEIVEKRGGRDLLISCLVALPSPIPRFGMGITIIGRDGYVVSRAIPGIACGDLGLRQGLLRTNMRIPDVMRVFSAGDYDISLSVHDVHSTTLLEADRVCSFTVPEEDIMNTGFPLTYSTCGPIPLYFRTTIDAAFPGVAHSQIPC